jgi:hypothetical protein
MSQSNNLTYRPTQPAQPSRGNMPQLPKFSF